MKAKCKKRILLLLSCLLVQSNGKVPCKKGFFGRDNSELKDDITDESCAAGSLCGRFELETMHNRESM